MAPGLAVIAIAVGFSGKGGAPPKVRTDADQELAPALLDALEGYESSLESIAWEQREYCPPSANRNRNKWLLLQTSSRYVDLEWRWFHRASHASAQPPKFDVVYSDDVFAGDGSFRLACDRRELRGMLSDIDPFF